MSTATANSVSVSVVGLSSAIKAAALFTAASRRGAEPSKYSRVRLAGSSGMIGVESTDCETRFTAGATFASWEYLESFGVGISPSTVSAALRGRGFDRADIVDDTLSVGGLSVSVSDETEKWEQTVADADPVGMRIVMDAETLFRIDREVAPASDNESSRYALGGILFDGADATGPGRYRRVHVVASDGRRMHVVTLPSGGAPVDGGSVDSCLIHAGTIKRVAKAVKATLPRGVSAESIAVTIEADSSGEVASIYWQVGEWQFVVSTGQTQGRFPRWRDCFPDGIFNHPIASSDAGEGDGILTWRGDAAAVSAACKDATRGVCKAPSKAYNTMPVKFSCIDGKATLSADHGSGKFSVDGIHATNGIEFQLRPEFVADALAGFPRGEEFRLFVENDEKKLGDPVFLRRGRGLHSVHSVGFSAVIMPVAKD